MLCIAYDMQVQDAVTDAGQLLAPPPTARPAASEQAAGGGQQFRSFKTPSATDLVENRGAHAPGLDGGGSSAGASGGTAAFPNPGPAPPSEAPATSGAVATAAPAAVEPAAPAASAPGAGWATFGDSQPEFARESSAPSAQPVPAAGGAAMSKAFGSFEQFAQVFACTCSLMCSPLACPQANCSPWLHMKIKSIEELCADIKRLYVL